MQLGADADDGKRVEIENGIIDIDEVNVGRSVETVAGDATAGAVEG